MEIQEGSYVCEYCGKVIYFLGELGYLGPRRRDDTSCHPYMDFIAVCRECDNGKSVLNQLKQIVRGEE